MGLFKPILVGVAPVLNESETIRAHKHYWTALTNPPDTATRWPTWEEVTAKPEVYSQAQIDAFLLNYNPVENGFSDRAESTLSFDAVTRTFTITPVGASFEFWAEGNRHVKTVAESYVIPDVEGIHFLYYDGLGVLRTTQAFNLDIIRTYAFVATVYWDATNKLAVHFGEERHGRQMDAGTHLWAHGSFGSLYDEGFQPGNLTVDGNGNLASHAQLSLTTGRFRDEDILHEVVDGVPQELEPVLQAPILYRNGVFGDWRLVPATSYPVTTTGTGRVAYNHYDGSAWSMAEVGNNNYTLVHIYATNDVRHPVMAVMGQAQYNNLGDARTGAGNEINNLQLGQLGSLMVEFIPLCTLIVQTTSVMSNAVKAAFRTTEEGDPYVDWRKVQGSSSGGAAASNHSSLTGLGNDDHPQYHNDARGDLRYSQLGHVHGNMDITDVDWGKIVNVPAYGTRWPTWSEVTAKPTTFLPSAHGHVWADLSGVPSYASRWPTWSEVTSKPTTFAPSAHTHPWSEITSQPTTLSGTVNLTGNQTVSGVKNFSDLLQVNRFEGTIDGDFNAFPTGQGEIALVSTGFQRSNNPGGGNFHSGVEFRHDLSSDYRDQMFFSSDPSVSRLWLRHFVVDTWSSWSEVFHEAHLPTWDEVTSKPTTFAPSAHTHTESDITDLGSYLPLSGGTLTGSITLPNDGDINFASANCRIEGTSSGADYIRFITSGTESLRSDSSGNLSVTGALLADGGMAHTHNGTEHQHIISPGGGGLSLGGTQTGAIKITMPATGTNDMVSFWVDVYDYSRGESFSVYLAGYVYQTIGNNVWVSESAIIFASEDWSRDKAVYFGHDGTNACVWIGEATDTYSYPKVIVRNVNVGLSATVDRWKDGWAISFDSGARTGTEATFTEALPFASQAKKLKTARTIDITGDITATAVAFDGTANIAISASVNDDSHNHIIGNVDGLQTALDGKLGNTGAQKITKDVHSSGASQYHLELYSPNIDAAGEISIRFHQGARWYHQIRDRSDGFHLTEGSSNSYVDLAAGAITESGTLLSSKYLPTAGGAIVASNTTLDVLLDIYNSNDSGGAELQVRGSGQGDGYLFVGQSPTYGGGVAYRGDGTSPKTLSGVPGSDYVSWYRRSNGTDYFVFGCHVNDSTVQFAGNITVPGAITEGGTALSSKYAASGHNHSGTYEPAFTKNSAFNKNFGTVAGTVTQGNDSRLSDARTPVAHGHPWSDITAVPDSLIHEERHDLNRALYGASVTPRNWPTGLSTMGFGSEFIGADIYPTSNWGMVFTAMARSPIYGFQIAADRTNDGGVYLRNHNDEDSWHPWSRLDMFDAQGVLQSNGTVPWARLSDVPATFPPDSHTHSYLPLSGGTLTGELSHIGTSLANVRHEWSQDHSVSNGAPDVLVYKDGGALPTGGVYRFTAHIAGTGTDQSARAVFWNQNGTWLFNTTSQSGTSSNHPEFILSGGLPAISIDHANPYTVTVYSERLELKEGTGNDNTGHAFGADSFMSSIGGTLRYNAFGGASQFAGTTVWHSGNFDPGTKSDTSHNHAGTYLLDSTDTFTGTLTVNGALTLDGMTLDNSAFRSGVLEINRLGTTAWTGIGLTFSSTASWNLMGNQTRVGLYDDVNNDWIFEYAENGSLELYHNGTVKASTQSYGLNVAGEIIATNNITAYSDERHKENILTVPQALDKVGQMRGVYFNRKDDETKTRRVGVIAQEIQKVLPEVVLDHDDALSVDYGNIVGVLIEAIKELKTEVELLKARTH